MTRLDQIRQKLAASLDANGNPLKGYGARVAALRQEIARQEAARGDTANDSVGVDTVAASA